MYREAGSGGNRVDTAVAIRKGYTRWQASGIYLLISATIAATALAVMLSVWYPRPLFEAQGGMGLLFILVGVDVVIGPVITLIIFESGKPGLRFDLATIATLQIIALMYGGYIVFEARPVFIVLVKDQFEVVIAADLEREWLKEARHPEFRRLPLTGPVLVVSDPPADEKERLAVIFSAIYGKRDMQQFPKYYVPYAERAQEARAKGRPLEVVRRREPVAATVIGKYLAESGRKESEVLYLPMRTRNEWIAVLVDATSGMPVKMLLVPD